MPDPVLLAADSRELAQALTEGQGMDALDVIFGGTYPTPGEQAALLLATAAVLKATSRPT